MRRSFIALISAVALLVVTVSATAAITKNFRVDNDHPFVGLVAFYDADWVFIHRCTGELLTPTVLLTAGHCPDDGSGSGALAAHARVWFLQDVGSHFDGVQDAVTGYPNSCTGTLGNGLGVWCAEADVMFNYGYDGFATFPNTHDAGIVILNQAIDVDEYASLASAGTIEALIKARGTQDTTMRVSGYGLSLRHIVPPQGPNAGGAPSSYSISYRVRLQADEVFSNLTSANSGGFSIQTEGNGTGQGGTCNGDSGGPLFWPADSNRVVAVTSWGILNAGCRGWGMYYRVDRQPVLDWIRSVVGETQWGQITVD